jgi:serine protease Do
MSRLRHVPRLAFLLVLGALLLGLPSAARAGETPPAVPATPKEAPVATPAGAVPVPVRTPATPSPSPDTAKALAFANEVDAALVRAVASVCESSVTVWNLRRTGPVVEGKPAPPLGRMSGGSGVFVTIRGKGPFVVTNEHVVRGADGLEIATHDGSVWPVKLRDHVPTYDIALLEFVKEKPKSWKAARLGKSEELVEGQWVVATGNPFFLGGDGRCVATFGVISGLERTVGDEFTYANAIQHDAEVNPGNSGGPLWNLAGELIGINGLISSRGGGTTLSASNTGASFAIPIHLIQRYFDALLSDKTAAAGYLGIDLEDARDPGGKPVGARVSRVKDDSPMKRVDPKANPLAAGDVITQISLGNAVTMKSTYVWSASDLTNAVAFHPAGAKVRIAYTRDGKKLAWAGELGGQTTPPAPPRSGRPPGSGGGK